MHAVEDLCRFTYLYNESIKHVTTFLHSKQNDIYIHKIFRRPILCVTNSRHQFSLRFSSFNQGSVQGQIRDLLNRNAGLFACPSFTGRPDIRFIFPSGQFNALIFLCSFVIFRHAVNTCQGSPMEEKDNPRGNINS